MVIAWNMKNGLCRELIVRWENKSSRTPEVKNWRERYGHVKNVEFSENFRGLHIHKLWIKSCGCLATRKYQVASKFLIDEERWAKLETSAGMEIFFREIRSWFSSRIFCLSLADLVEDLSKRKTCKISVSFIAGTHPVHVSSSFHWITFYCNNKFVYTFLNTISPPSNVLIIDSY